MTRTILTEDLIKNELGITHSGCISSFSSVISRQLALTRKNKEAEELRIKLDLEHAKVQRDMLQKMDAERREQYEEAKNNMESIKTTEDYIRQRTDQMRLWPSPSTNKRWRQLR